MKLPLAAASRRLLSALAALLLGLASATAEEAVLVSSTAPGLTPGMILGDGQPLSLPEGASATLLFRSGQMVKLQGPFSGALPAPEGAASATALAGALRMQGVDASVIGGSRDVAPSARRAMSGHDIPINPQRSATYCIGSRDSLWLPRPASGERLMGLRRKQSMRMVAWPEGAAQIEWPDDVMIEDGDRFDLVDAEGAAHASIVFRRFPSAPRSETAWVAQMLLSGCTVQADSALREVERNSLAPELYIATDRGRQPAYRIGDRIRLTVQSNLDGQLYCFARDIAGTTVPIFPAGAAGGPRIEGHVPLAIPGPRLPAEIRAAPPAGTDEIRCYLADRDIAAEVPGPLLDANPTPLPAELADGLDTVFAAIPMARIAKASLAVRIE
jgi:hypothetical protein